MTKIFSIKRRRPRWLPLLVGIIILVLGVASRVLLKDSQPPPSNPTPHYSADVVSNSTNTPDEQAPSQDYESTAKDNEPAMLRIPSINVNAHLQKVGVDQRTEIAVPNNIHIAGWFVDSAKPGEPGLSIIDGHLDGIYEKGVFSQLAAISVGDRFSIERGDKQSLTFEVISKQTIKAEYAANILFSQDSHIPSQLNLITCGGAFDKQSRTYNDRIIVSARFVSA